MQSQCHIELKQLAKKLFHDAYPCGDTSEYLNHQGSIEALLSSFDGIASDITLRPDEPVTNRIAISTVLSDFTSIYIESPVRIGLYPDEPTAYPSKIANLSPTHPTHYCYWFGFLDDELQEELVPLVNGGRIMLRPSPILEFKDELGRQHAVDIEPNLPEGFWLPWRNDVAQNSIPIKRQMSSADILEKSAEIVLPFIEGVDLRLLSKILDDEQELLTDFRLTLKQLVNKVQQDGDGKQDFVNDVVRPATDKLERKFRVVNQMHALRVAGATVSTCAISLLSMTDNGVAASVGKILGPAGLGLMAKEVADYIKAKAELRDMPYYLLWRISRNKPT
jgi:hypothetical protein